MKKRLMAIGAVIALALAACGDDDAPTDTGSIDTDPPVDTVTPTVEETVPDTPVDTVDDTTTDPTVDDTTTDDTVDDTTTDDTTAEGDGSFSLSAPDGWEVVDLTAGDVAVVWDDMVATQPELADYLGGPEALEQADLWAFGPVGETGFSPNLNVIVQPITGLEVDAVVSEMESTYEMFGWEILDHEILEVNGLPTVKFQVDIPEANPEVGDAHSVQYLVIGENNFYTVSYGVLADDVDELAPVFSDSIATFQEH